MSVLAAVDIGSNSVRLKVARIVHHRLKTVHEDRFVTRLGESVFRDGALSPEAMDTTIKVLRGFHRVVRSYGSDRVRVVGTSALREASNSAAFLAWVQSAIGWKVETISGLEEGRLIHLGLLTNSRISGSDVLLIDLGGGSCELTVSKHGHIRDMFSLPLGAVRLTREFLNHDPPTDAEIRRLRKDIGEEIGTVRRRIAAGRVSSAIATSGTAAALAGAQHAVEPSNRGAVARTAVWRLAEELSKLDTGGRSKWPGIGPRRAEIIIAGAYVFAELMERSKLSSFRYSPLGLRDGMLAQMLADHDRAARSRRQVEAEREDAVLAMCRRYEVDTAAADNVRRLALQDLPDPVRVGPERPVVPLAVRRVGVGEVGLGLPQQFARRVMLPQPRQPDGDVGRRSAELAMKDVALGQRQPGTLGEEVDERFTEAEHIEIEVGHA